MKAAAVLSGVKLVKFYPGKPLIIYRDSVNKIRKQSRLFQSLK